MLQEVCVWVCAGLAVPGLVWLSPESCLFGLAWDLCRFLRLGNRGGERSGGVLVRVLGGGHFAASPDVRGSTTS